MSTDERHATLGRALEEFTAIRTELAALQNRAREIGDPLHDLGYYLCSFGKTDPNATKARKALASLPTISEINELVEDIQKQKLRQQELRQILKDAGVDPKE